MPASAEHNGVSLLANPWDINCPDLGSSLQYDKNDIGVYRALGLSVLFLRWHVIDVTTHEAGNNGLSVGHDHAHIYTCSSRGRCNFHTSPHPQRLWKFKIRVAQTDLCCRCFPNGCREQQNYRDACEAPTEKPAMDSMTACNLSANK